jgi:hypothetical protein
MYLMISRCWQRCFRNWGDCSFTHWNYTCNCWSFLAAGRTVPAIIRAFLHLLKLFLWLVELSSKLEELFSKQEELFLVSCIVLLLMELFLYR